MPPADEANPFRRPLTLRDWHFVYGLPVKPDEYLASEANHGFGVFGGYQGWNEYEPTLHDMKAVLEPFEAAGLDLAWGQRPQTFCKLLQQRNAVILLTHAAKATKTTEGALEFRGELVPFGWIVGRVSPSFTGILDICACESDGIQEPLKRRAPGCATKVADKPLHLDVWIAHYAEFLRLFFEKPTTYYDAIMRARSLI
jgi:hypothetical protein